MHTITYVSTANPDLKEWEIQNLLENARMKNELNNITGIFIYSSGNFFQILEGKKEIVLQLYEKIKQDIRHHSIIKLKDQKVKNLVFSNYISSFTIVSESTNIKGMFKFLKREKHYNPKGYKNIEYSVKKFMSLI